MDLDSNLALLVTLFGSVGVPWITSLAKHPAWPTQVKRVLALVVAIGFAVVTVIVDEGLELNVNDLVGSGAAIYALSQVTYRGIWKDTRTDEALTTVFASGEYES